jgi:uncharacterized protein CbrC (UPF0167 family)
MPPLPEFRYHPDPLRTGSVIASPDPCLVCGQARGFLYDGPIYTEHDLTGAICPWCIADGAAAEKYDATFVDSEAFPDAVPSAAIDEITTRTPGYSAWQSEHWPACCGDATVFQGPTGIQELRQRDRTLEGPLMSHIVYNMAISGGAASRLLESLNRDKGPTAYVFHCPQCLTHHFHVDWQ